MLIHLVVQHLAVVENLPLDFDRGMTVLTGETGAGKSILIDALQLTLGERADSSIIRHQAQDATVSASYDITALKGVYHWLVEHELASAEECIIRRTLSPDGRSKAFINGHAVPLSQLRELGWQLVNIHGQHQHQALLKADHQRKLLDQFADHELLLQAVELAYNDIRTFKKEYQALQKNQGQTDKLTLLQYQIQELKELNLGENELETLTLEQKELAHAEHWLSLTQNAVVLLKNKEYDSQTGQDALSSIYQAMTALQPLKNQTSKLNTCEELLKSALIQLNEAISELEAFEETLSLDPTRLSAVETRLSQIHQMARKHRIQPELLFEHQLSLEKEVVLLQTSEAALNSLNEKIKTAHNAYQQAANHLSQSRQKAAIALQEMVVASIRTLEMPNAEFHIQFLPLDPDKSPTALGFDEIEFLVSTNPGLPLQPLRKIASGGELSRISLAIQVITATKMTTPTLIFDEVDAGISGKTAETVGKLLKKLSSEVQVLCVTHLPQIAAQGDHHFKVTKEQTVNSTHTDIKRLSQTERVEELARMVGGAKITESALRHAKEMLEAME